jgi:hypothetical protein
VSASIEKEVAPRGATRPYDGPAMTEVPVNGIGAAIYAVCPDGKAATSEMT